MNAGEIITLSRTLVGEDNETADLTDVHMFSMLNATYQKVNNVIDETYEKHFGQIDQTIDLVSGTQNYDLPDRDANDRTRVVRILRIEVAYDGTNFYKSHPINVQDLPNTNFVDTSFSTVSPAHYLLDDQLYLVPTPTANATNAVRIWYVQRQLPLESDGDIPSFPEQYHHILAYGVAADIMKRSGAPVLDNDDLSYADRFSAEFNSGLDQLLGSLAPRDDSHAEYVREEDMYIYNPLDFEQRGSIT